MVSLFETTFHCIFYHTDTKKIVEFICDIENFRNFALDNHRDYCLQHLKHDI